MNNKQIFLALLISFILSFAIVGVGAYSNVVKTNSIANASNYSTSLTNITCVSNAEDIINVTFWYNASAHTGVSAVTTERLNYTENTSVHQKTNFSEVTFDISGLADADTYTFWCEFQNKSNMTSANSTYYNITNITIDNTAPIVKVYSDAGVSISHDNATAYKNTATVTFNVSVYDLLGLADSAFCFFDINLSNESVSLSKANSTHGWCNTTHLNLTNAPDGVNITNVYANDSLGNMRLNNSVYVHVDTSVPSTDASCTPASVTEGSTVTCSCGGSDSVTSVNSTTADSTPSTLTEGTFTYTCTVADQAGNSASEDATYIVEDSAGTSPGGTGPGTTTTTPQTTHLWMTISPGDVVVMENLASGIGVEQIQIEVSSEAQNVKLTVTKHETKPAAVSVEKTGEIYQYLQIEAQNLETELSKGTVTIRVEKTWVSEQGLDRDSIVLSKFDEAAEQWNELTTTFGEEDDTNYYYDVELTSFSYFAIGEKGVEEEGGLGVDGEPAPGVEGEEGEEREEEAEGDLTWLWILIIIVVIVVVIGGGQIYKKKRQ